MNFQLKTDEQINSIVQLGNTPKLLLHSCCAPCSSYVIEYLSEYFELCVLYYNPNIYPAQEYQKRLDEQRRLISLMKTKNPISIIEIGYNSDEFYQACSGLENAPEGGIRCEKCIALRMEKAAALAKSKGFDYFTTTLSVSPHKNALFINQTGQVLEKKYDVKYLYADFKKREGYKRSIQLSTEYNLYRQNYCGCEFSIHDKVN